METTKSKSTGKKKQKILVQIGVIIIVLFTLVTVAVGNMITMASFSTALSSNMTSFVYIMENMIDNMDDYRSLPWLMDYWKDNADLPFSEGGTDDLSDEIDGILKKLSKEDVRDVTSRETESLSEEEQKIFALWCFEDIEQIFLQYYNDANYTITLTANIGDDDDQFVLFNSGDGEDESSYGGIIDLTTLKQIIRNTDKAVNADVWRWAFTTPDQLMLFATSIPLSDYTDLEGVEMYGLMQADLVYEDMAATGHIKNEVIIMLLLVFALILLFLYFIVPWPLEKVKKCVSEYSDTKDANALTEKLSRIHSHNEIGAFADEFSSLAQEMDRYTREIEKMAGEREKAATELNVARDIQKQMLPQVFPEREAFSLFASMNPAKEVGGDFYDCYMIDDDHLALTIADVSGKGVPASLFMAVSKTMLKDRTIVGGGPSAILSDVNNWLSKGNENCMFVTVWLGILTVSTGELVCANAGHENPGIRSGEEPFRLCKTEHGSPLGLMKGMEFADEHYKFSPGDALFLYTDGVPEANSLDEEMFGEERLESVLTATSREDSPQIIMQKVKKAVDDFAGDTPQYDDLTMLCLVIN